MSFSPPTHFAFHGPDRLAIGSLSDVALAVKSALAADPAASILVFEGATGQQIDLDLRGGEAGILARYAPPPPPAPTAGRPKLGVVAREVTLLPRHWDWLAKQTGGTSVALRKLVDEARKISEEPERRRSARDAAYRFMSAIAGDLPGFEDAARALYAGDMDRFHVLASVWPADMGRQLMAMLGD